MEIQYIDEETAKGLIKKAGDKAIGEGKKFITNPTGFSGHLINTGRNAELVAERILGKNSDLQGKVTPKIVRVAGFMHDFGKINIGDPYHEIEGAYEIIEGGKELGLVSGEGNLERELIRIAFCLPGDFALLEEMGKDFPDSALYSAFVTPRLKNQVEVLRRKFSPTGEPLSIATLCSPDTLEKQIALYADMTDVHGGGISYRNRLDDIVARYTKLASEADTEASKNYWATLTGLTKQISPRIFNVCERIEKLAGIS